MSGKSSTLRRWASALTRILITTGLFSSCFKQRHATWNTPEDYYALPRWSERVNAFMQISRSPMSADLFIGDSITEGLDLTYFFGDSTLVNMGIGGDFTEGILKRMLPVERLQPRRIFLMIGINDVLKRLPASTISSNHQSIVQAMQKACPQAQIFVQSLLPIRSSYRVMEGRKRVPCQQVLEEIRRINANLAEICSEHDVAFVDLYPAFLDRSGELQSDLTYDGLHLNNNGNRMWTTLIQPLLD